MHSTKISLQSLLTILHRLIGVKDDLFEFFLNNTLEKLKGQAGWNQFTFENDDLAEVWI